MQLSVKITSEAVLLCAIIALYHCCFCVTILNTVYWLTRFVLTRRPQVKREMKGSGVGEAFL